MFLVIPKKITHIAWITHNRKENLIRSVRSFLDENDPNLFHLCISNSSPSSIKNEIQQLNSYIDIQELESRKNWIESLKMNAKEKGIAPELIHFALTPNCGPNVSTGANRNFLLLYFANKRFLSLDDDTLFNIRTLDEKKSWLPSTKNNPLSLMYLKDIQEFEELIKISQKIKSEDFFCAHEAQLNLGSALSLTGYAGDSGFSNPKSIFGLEEAPLKALLSSTDNLNYSLSSRFIWRQSLRPTQISLSSLMPMAAAFNNELELPPFFPIGRNQDGAYAYALNACLEKAQLSYIDMAILHRPLETRSYLNLQTNYQLRINDLVSFIWIEF